MTIYMSIYTWSDIDLIGDMESWPETKETKRQMLGERREKNNEEKEDEGNARKKRVMKKIITEK